MSDVAAAPVPTLAFDAFACGDSAARLGFARAFRDALHEFGFAVIARPPLAPAGPGCVAEVYRAFRRFFAFDDAEKRRCGGVADGQRGYTAFGVEHARDHPYPDLKEFYHVGQRDGPHLGLPPNVWPTRLPGLQQLATPLFEALERCAVVLLDALELAEALPTGTFSGMLDGGNHVLRALHYPPVPEDVHPSSLRAAPHEDINLITLLCEASEPGLEILRPDHGWLAIEAEPDELVVNAGDMLARMTNGTIPATTHRVTNPKVPDHRYSLAFFAHPRPACDLSVLPDFVTPTAPARTAPITAGEFLAERLREIGLT